MKGIANTMTRPIYPSVYPSGYMGTVQGMVPHLTEFCRQNRIVKPLTLYEIRLYLGQLADNRALVPKVEFNVGKELTMALIPLIPDEDICKALIDSDWRIHDDKYLVLPSR